MFKLKIKFKIKYSGIRIRTADGKIEEKHTLIVYNGINT